MFAQKATFLAINNFGDVTVGTTMSVFKKYKDMKFSGQRP